MPRRMSVGSRLAAAFAVHVAILIVLLIFHVGTIRESVRAGHELSETSARLYASSTEQVARLDQLQETLSKYVVTTDTGYLAKFEQVSNEVTRSLELVATLTQDERERHELRRIEEAKNHPREHAPPQRQGDVAAAFLADSPDVLAPLYTLLYQRVGRNEAASQ